MALSKQTMPLKERSKELDRVSTKFVEGGFPLTANWIKRLSKTLLLPRVTFGEALADWKDIEQTFKNEFIGSDENWKYRERCYDALDKIVHDMIKARGIQASSKTFEMILPALERGNEALSNIAEIYLALVASKRLSEKRRYYGLCFMYLISVEGLYDENIKILYIFRKAAKGVDVDYDTISEDKSLWSFKSELQPVFFEGYNNRIRNAIAHAKFRFDDAKNKMIFKDIATKHQPEYRDELSLTEFAIKYYDKIDSFCRLRTFYMILLGVKDLIIAPRPFGKTRAKP